MWVSANCKDESKRLYCLDMQILPGWCKPWSHVVSPKDHIEKILNFPDNNYPLLTLPGVFGLSVTDVLMLSFLMAISHSDQSNVYCFVLEASTAFCLLEQFATLSETNPATWSQWWKAFWWEETLARRKPTLIETTWLIPVIFFEFLFRFLAKFFLPTERVWERGKPLGFDVFCHTKNKYSARVVVRWCPCCCVRGPTLTPGTTGTTHHYTRLPSRAR